MRSSLPLCLSFISFTHSLLLVSGTMPSVLTDRLIEKDVRNQWVEPPVNVSRELAFAISHFKFRPLSLSVGDNKVGSACIIATTMAIYESLFFAKLSQRHILRSNKKKSPSERVKLVISALHLGISVATATACAFCFLGRQISMRSNRAHHPKKFARRTRNRSNHSNC